ncbi:MAG TPA: choice-of-anchor J domain-containing protein [Bacteroidales bacterium]|mgnify:CR=1 FL=1|nr:choice-of-anchor J domain-containing protein [Bacteroidales bacterium]
MKKSITKSFLALFGLIMFANFATTQTIILEEGFENGLPSTWLSIDDDGDGHFWTTDKSTLFSSGSLSFPAHSGSGAIGSGSTYSNNNVWEPLTPDNWLISPDISGADTMSYWVRSDIGGSSMYDTERYGIYASSTGRNFSDFTMIAYDSTSGLYNSYAQRGVSLPAGTKYLAFRHYNTTDQGAIVLDDIQFINSGSGTSDVNMSRYVELNVQQGQWISLDLAADAENTGVKVVSGTKDTILTAGTSWTDFKNYYAQAGTMKVYGNINKFDCYNNGNKITGLDASNNTGLINLYCDGNNLSSLDLTNLTVLERLTCYDNNLSSLDLTNLTALEYLNCSGNNFSSLEITNLTALQELFCSENNLSSIKTSGCDNLRYISCYSNNLSACGLDSLFYQLPIRPADDKGRLHIKGIDVMKRGTNTNPGALSCRDTIATNRNWEVWDYDENAPIINTSYACPYFTLGIEDVGTNNISAKVFPNPVSNNLNIECEEKIDNLELYDALGKMLIRKKNVLDNTSIDVSNLNSGIYILKIRTEKGSGEYKVIVE